MSKCGTSEQFERLLAGKLSDAETQALEVHVEACVHCQESLALVVASTAAPDWKLLRAPSPGTMPAADEDFLRHMKENPPGVPGGAPGAVAGAESATIQFPGPPTAKGPLGQLESYHIRKRLGQGSYGVVYQAYDALDRLVAIKILKPEFATSPLERARFAAEARAGAAVKHDHVVTIYQIGDTPDFSSPYLVMEYVEGETLSDQLRRKELPAPKEVARLVRQVALGLAAAHGQGLLHRDIKPGNILLEQATRRAKITDFGLACALEDSSTRVRPSERLVGTLAYLCPEQIVPLHPPDRRSDVYSLGVVLYELLTGERPFHGVKHMVLQQIVHDEPRPPRKLNDHVARDLETITLKCLAKEPKRRYQSAQELADDLQRWLDNQPIQARPVRSWERALMGAKRRPAVTALASLLVLVAALGFGLVLWQWQLAQAAFETAEGARREATDTAGKEAAARRDAQTERANAENARTLAEWARSKAEEQRRLALGFSTRLSRDLLGHGEIGRGMILLAHSLKATGKDAELQRPILANLASWHHRLSRLTTLLEHPGAVNAVAFSYDGKLILTACGDFLSEGAAERGTAQLWEVATGKPVGPPMVHQSSVLSVAFSHDGKEVVTGCQAGIAQLWNAATSQAQGEPFRHEDKKGVTAVAFSHDGTTVLTGSEDRTARLWNVVTAQPRGKPLHHELKVTAVAFSLDDKSVVTGSMDGTARHWNAATGEPLGLAMKHGINPQTKKPGVVRAVAFSPDGRTILTGGWGIWLWDAATGQPQGEALPRSQDVIRTVAFRDNGRTFLTASYYFFSSIDLWDVNTRRHIGPPLRNYGAADALPFSPTGQTERPAVPARGTTGAIAVSPDGRTVLAGSRDGMARLWEVTLGVPVDNRHSKTLRHERGLHAVAFSPDGASVLTGSQDNTAQLWDVATGEPCGKPFQHAKGVTAVAFSPNCKTILTGSEDGTARLWDVATGQLIEPTMKHSRPINGVAFSPDSRTILTGSGDSTAQLWDAATGQLRGEPLQHRDVVQAVAFSPDGRIALTGSQDGTARLWDALTGKFLDLSLPHGARIQAVAFSPDGKKALTGGFDSIVRVWEVATGKLLEPSLLDHNQVHGVAFSPDGRTILTGVVTGRAQLWDAVTGQRLGMPFVHTDSVRAVAFSPDGRSILTGSWDKDRTACLWQLPVPLDGDVDRIVLWIQVATGMEVDSTGEVSVLSAPDWHERRRRLWELGGPPVP